jgi:hypothetical protein
VSSSDEESQAALSECTGPLTVPHSEGEYVPQRSAPRGTRAVKHPRMEEEMPVARSDCTGPLTVRTTEVGP